MTADRFSCWRRSTAAEMRDCCGSASLANTFVGDGHCGHLMTALKPKTTSYLTAEARQHYDQDELMTILALSAIGGDQRCVAVLLRHMSAFALKDACLIPLLQAWIPTYRPPHPPIKLNLQANLRRRRRGRPRYPCERQPPPA